MSTVKERISQDLEKVKEKGAARTQKIREIVKVAVGESLSEVKGGATEIRTIAQDAVTTVIEHLKGKGQQAKNDMMAAMEGAVAAVSDNPQDKPQDSHQAANTIDNTTDKEQQVLEAVDGALVAVESHQQKQSSRFLSLLLAAFNAFKQRFFTGLQKEYVSLQELLADWDGRLTQRYGDRYTQVKQRWETAQESYQQTKTKMRSGEPSPVDQQQAAVVDKASQVGATVAQTEQVVKQQLKTFLNKTADKIS